MLTGWGWGWVEMGRGGDSTGLVSRFVGFDEQDQCPVLSRPSLEGRGGIPSDPVR